MVFTIRARWGDGEDRHVDGFQYSRGAASIHGGVFAHFFHDNHGFSNLKSFRFTLELVWGVRRRGCGVVLRRRGAFSNMVG